MNEKTQNKLEAVGQLLHIADKLNQQYNVHYISNQSPQQLLGYEVMRDLRSGQLNYACGRLMSQLPKFMNWAKQYNGAENTNMEVKKGKDKGKDKQDNGVGLVRYFLRHAERLSPICAEALVEYQQPLTVEEKTTVMLGYMAGPKKEEKAS